MFRTVVNVSTGEVTQVPLTQEEIDAIPPTPVPTVPQAVDALDGLLAIYQMSPALAEAYEAWTSNPARTFVQRAFINKAKTWRRDDPTLLEAAEAFGLTSGQVDAMFVSASPSQ